MVDWDGSTAPELLIVLLTRQIVGPCFGEGLLAFLLKEIAIAGTRGLDIGDRSVGVAFSPQQPPSDGFSFAHIHAASGFWGQAHVLRALPRSGC